jgi:hypothetical protein
LPELIRTASKQIAQVAERPMTIKREDGQFKLGSLREKIRQVSKETTADLVRDALSSGGKMKRILDLTAGNRAIWFNKNHPEAVYLDKRKTVKPTIVCNTRKIPKSAGSGYDLVVYDPPHMNCGPNSNMSKVYGHHTTKEILRDIGLTSKEAHRVTRPGALMALKWNTHDIRLSRVFDLLLHWEPLFGHLTKDGPGSQTYWVMLRRKDSVPQSKSKK